MDTILLVISTSGFSPEAMEYALQEAKRRAASISCYYIIEDEIPDAVSSWLIYIGFMGDEPSSVYRNIIQQEYKQRAAETLEEARQIAAKQQIPIEAFVVEGNFIEQILEIAEKLKAVLIVTHKPMHVDFIRLIHGSKLDELKKRAPCEVKVVGE